MNNEIILEPIILPTQVFYLYYNNEGYITELLNYKKDTGNYIEVSDEFVVSFRESNKDLSNFKVEIDNSCRIIRNDNLYNQRFYFIIYETDDITDLVILIGKKELLFTLSSNLGYNLQDSATFSFYIVSKINPNFLLVNIPIKYGDLKKGYRFKYKFDNQKEIITTVKYFNSYKIKYE
jgi:hypothetical protein